MPAREELPDPDAPWRLEGGPGVAPSGRARASGHDPSPHPYIVPSAAMADASAQGAARTGPDAHASGVTWLVILAVLGAGAYAVMSAPPWLYGPALAITTFMDSAPSFPIVLLYIALGAIPVTLVHELGHAIAARRLLGVAVDVTVGNVGRLATLRLGEISLSLNAIGSPAGVGGSASFDAARARDVLMIALAGPAASAAGLVVALAILPAAGGGVAHHLMWAITGGSAFGVLNLIPFAYEERRGGRRVQSDGLLALDALRSMRSLR